MSVHTLQGTTRPAAQAGRFYDDDPERLRDQIKHFLGNQKDLISGSEPLALLSPHAGYPYSGRVAAAAYRTIQGKPISHVLILAPSHYGDFVGAALPTEAFFATPLGKVPVDQKAVSSLMERPDLCVDETAHATEHSIEVQLPFLQVALDQPFSIVPVLLGRVPAGGLDGLSDEFTRLIEQRKVLGERWLVIASSDTYHGYDSAGCLANDQGLTPLLEAMDPDAVFQQCQGQGQGRGLMACGWQAITLVMRLARRQGAETGRVLMRSDSGHEARIQGDYVVGYIAAAFI